MTSVLQIAEVARRSGFAPTTLRYYEEIGLVRPTSRTPAGYRLYDEAILERLAFIGRAKQLGCSLDEISELVSAWDGARCAPVQDHLRTLLASKVEAAHGQIAELLALTSQLQQVRTGLGGHTPDGPCDDQCGCIEDAPRSGDEVPVAISIGPAAPPVACMLDGNSMASRLDEWQALLGLVTSRSPLAGGLRVTFAADTPLGEIVRLAQAEHDCCQFFSFAITVDGRGVALDVTGPPEAEPIIAALFGVAP
jgi:MerR family copper efflux transcriptional regulator